MATKSGNFKTKQGKPRHFRRAEDLADAIRDRLTASTGEAVATNPDAAPPALRAQPKLPDSPSDREYVAASPDSREATSPSIQAAWQRACGSVLPEALERTSLIRQDESILVVYVESPVWATRIRLAAPSLIRSLQSEGLPETTELRIRVLPREHAAPEPRKRTASLTPRSAQVIGGIAERMGKTDLGESLRRLARTRKNTSSDTTD